MKNCTQCNAEIKENEKVCPDCGKEVEETAANTVSDLADKVAELNNTADTTAEYDENDISNNKILALFSYIGILFLVPLLAAKDSKFARFHVNQGLVLFIFELAWSVVYGILFSVTFVLGLSVIVSVIGNVVNLLFIVVAILGIVNAVQGKAKELPVIGKIKILK